MEKNQCLEEMLVCMFEVRKSFIPPSKPRSQYRDRVHEPSSVTGEVQEASLGWHFSVCTYMKIVLQGI